MGTKDTQEGPTRHVLIGVLVGLSFLQQISGTVEGKYGFFSADTNSEVLLQGTVWNIKDNGVLTQFSFLTCSNGEFLFQNGSSGDSLRLSILNGTLEFHWSIGGVQSQIYLGSNLNNNQWYTLNTVRYLGDLFLNVSQGGRRLFSEILSNSTYRTYFSNIDLSGGDGIHVGRGYTGCMLEGPTVIFRDNPTGIVSSNVTWSNSSCDSGCITDSGNVNECLNHPCVNGECIDEPSGYRCECRHLYNGTNCDFDLSQYGCSVEPCLNNGSCVTETSGNRNYRCDCAAGFTGVNCEYDINECGSNPCQQGSECINKVAAYECNCTGTGYIGTNCDSDIDECATTNICGDGIKCFNNPGSYTCGCRAGFFGTTCQDIDECNSDPCLNGGTCNNLENAFSCDCAVGYTGAQCEVNADDCVTASCPGPNSRCEDGLNMYTCICKHGYTGTPGNCVDIDECLSRPCQNGGTCNNLENAYNCSCVTGYRGTDCSENIDDCIPQPCYNGATCVDGVNAFTCMCAPGFTGSLCNDNIDECTLTSQPCYNGGRCFDGVNGYTCSCASGYTGMRCGEDINECASNPCGMYSTLCTQLVNDYRCTCEPGYTGKNCNTEINECDSDPCLNGGNCTDLINSFMCKCPQDRMGDRCEMIFNACDSSLENCKNEANCTTRLGTQDYNCTCVSGFTGNQCEVNIDDCPVNACSDPFVCHDEVNYYRCGCPTGYEGPNCTTDTNECLSSPCKNGASCIGGIGNYTCECVQSIERVPGRNQTFLTGFTGVNCEEDINECENWPNICLNGGECKNEHPGRFQCLCGDDNAGTFFTGSHCEGSTSYCFIAEDVKDNLPACKNNGTCRGLDRNYTCTCAPGFTGRRCEVNIDECESNPCQYNGTCKDGINGYTCDCIPGINGTNCEFNIDDCDPDPCLHGSVCVDGINRYDCNCSDTGFKGVNCSINIDDCEPEPCSNGANCTDGIKEYFCHCHPGYTGSDCDVDIDECAAVPCFFNSQCLQYSNKTLYDIDYSGFENLQFSYATAAGYLCECVTGSTGEDCETNIDDCVHDNCNNGTCFDLLNAYRCDCFAGYKGQYCDTEIDECEVGPCKNSATCIDKIADYDCSCVPYDQVSMPYAGKNCTFELTACLTDECQNGATCRPLLVNEAMGEQSYECLCGEGFTGRFCNLSTTVSFNSSSIEASLVTADVSNLQTSFKFRTTLTDSVLLSWAHASGLFLTVELKSGQLVLQYLLASNTLMSSAKITGVTFNDGQWQYVKLTKFGGLSMQVTSPKCITAADCEIKVLETSISSSQPLDKLMFGNANSSLIQNTLSGTQFVGCMEDITVQGTRLSRALADAQHTYTNIVMGCPRTAQCLPMTCNQKGNCVDLWNTFRCDCFRPNLGDQCETEYVAATFSHSTTGDSYAAFNLQNIQNTWQNKADISFFFRSRKQNGLIMFFGNAANYVGVLLTEGHVGMQFNLCGSNKLVITENDLYASGNQQFVQLDRTTTGMKLLVNGTDQVTASLTNCNFNDQYLIFGGQTSLSNRRKRDTVTVTLNLQNLDSFKGTVQDARLNDKSLQFFDLSDPSLSDLDVLQTSDRSNLLEDEVTDPVCNMTSPCENNSTCHDVFYNDYRCDCLLGYRGKNCSELDFCVTGTCPDGSTCQSLLDGFECISTATFNGENTYADYSHTLSNIVGNSTQTITFQFRTLAFNGKDLMHISDGTNFYKVSIVGSRLVLDYALDGSTMTSLVGTQNISDSSWYRALITESTSQVTFALHNMDNQEIDSETGVRPSTTGSASLTTLLKSSGTTIRLGNPTRDNLSPNYQGCLTEVRIAGVLLPFFNDALFVNNTSPRRFLLGQNNQLSNGCIAGRGCGSSACIGSTTETCEDSYYSQICTCKTGYTGDWCQDLEDYCAVDDCVHGRCVNRLDGAQCKCPAGYTGTRCEEDVNECVLFPGICNNGTCQNENGTFFCTCNNGFSGSRCDVELTEDCSNNPCYFGNCSDITEGTRTTFNCSCDPGYEGDLCDQEIDYCSDLPCYHGNCTSLTSTQTYHCACPTGFSGTDCEANIDDCPANACRNGGECVDGINSYTCNCTASLYWEGSICELDINECDQNQPCQNRGTCVNHNDGFTCACDDTGFTGIYCQEDIDECDVNPDICRNDGNCTNTVGSYYCNCSEGYVGDNCENPDCDSVPCVNDATCIVTSSNTWACSCLSYYEGKYCDIRGPCVDEPCNATYTLACNQNVTSNTYSCDCKTGWTGDRCYEDIDECNGTTNPCKNNATCVNTPGAFECDCAVGYTDAFCQTDIDECSPRPCQNGGACINGIGVFECNCTGTGYQDLTCTVDVDECTSSPCLYGGTCVNSEGSFSCTCAEGYEGADCSVKVEKSMDDDITWYIVGPCVALVLILIVIGVIWFLMCVRKRRATRGDYSPSRQEVTGSRVELGNVLKKPPLERLI